MKIKFFKFIGGYDICLKWRGRWHWAGRQYGLQPLKYKGYTLERVGTPRAVERAFKKHGNTRAALMRELPHIDLNDIPAVDQGDCYKAAAKFVLDNEGWLLVHGRAVGQGVAHGHAWAERITDDLVMDTSGGKTITMSAELYYAIGRIRDTVHYTREEARAHLLRSKHWGPWK